MKKNFGAFGAGQFSLETLVGGRPGTTIFRNPGGGGGWEGGGSHTRTGPGHPPVDHACMRAERSARGWYSRGRAIYGTTSADGNQPILIHC